MYDIDSQNYELLNDECCSEGSSTYKMMLYKKKI